MSTLPSADDKLDQAMAQTSEQGSLIEKIIHAAEMLVKPVHARDSEGFFEAMELEENPLLSYEEKVLDDVKAVMNEEGVLSEGFAHALHRIQCQVKGNLNGYSPATISEQRAVLAAIEMLNKQAKQIDSHKIDSNPIVITTNEVHTPKGVMAAKFIASAADVAAPVAAGAPAARLPAGNALPGNVGAGVAAPANGNPALAINNGAPAPAINNGAPAPAINNGAPAPAINNGAPAPTTNNGAPADAPKPPPIQSWADFVNPFNWNVFGRNNKPATTTAPTDTATDNAEVDLTVVESLLNDFEVDAETTTNTNASETVIDAPNPSPAQNLADTINPLNWNLFGGNQNPAATTTPADAAIDNEEVDSATVESLLNDFEVDTDATTNTNAGESTVIEAPAATTVEPKPTTAQTWADFINPLTYLNPFGVSKKPATDATTVAADSTVAADNTVVADPTTIADTAINNEEVDSATVESLLNDFEVDAETTTNTNASESTVTNTLDGTVETAPAATTVEPKPTTAQTWADFINPLTYLNPFGGSKKPATDTTTVAADNTVVADPTTIADTAINNEEVDSATVESLLNDFEVDAETTTNTNASESTVTNTLDGTVETAPAATTVEPKPTTAQTWADFLNPLTYLNPFGGSKKPATDTTTVAADSTATETPLENQEIDLDTVNTLLDEFEKPATTTTETTVAADPTTVATDNTVVADPTTIADTAINNEEVDSATVESLLNDFAGDADATTNTNAGESTITEAPDATVETAPATTIAEPKPTTAQAWADQINPVSRLMNWWNSRQKSVATETATSVETTPTATTADTTVNTQQVDDLLNMFDADEAPATPAVDTTVEATPTDTTADTTVNTQQVDDLLNMYDADEAPATPAVDTTEGEEAITFAAPPPTTQPTTTWGGWIVNTLSSLMTAKAPATSTPEKQNDVTSSATAATGTESTSSAQPEASQTTPAEEKPETFATDTGEPMTTQTVADAVNPVNHLLSFFTAETPVVNTVETPAVNTVETPAANTVETPATNTVETPATNTVETPAANTVETSTPQTLVGGIADKINPLPFLNSWFSTATATPNPTETANLRDVSTNAPTVSGLTQSVLNIAQGKPATLRQPVEKTAQIDVIDDELAPDLRSLFNMDEKTTVATPVSGTTASAIVQLDNEQAVDSDALALLNDFEAADSESDANVNSLLEDFEIAGSESDANTNSLLEDFEIADDESGEEVNSLLVADLLNRFNADTSSIQTSDVLSGDDQQDVVDSLLANFTEAKSPSHSMNAHLGLTQGAPLVSGTLKTAISNLHIAQEQYELANANKLLADQAVERYDALKTSAQQQVEIATEYANSFKEVAYTSRTAKFFDFGAPTDPQQAVEWAQNKAHNASAYLGNKVSEYSQILFKDKTHSITEVKQFLAETISTTEALLQQTRTEFAPLVETYETSKATLWFGAMRAPYPAGYIEKQAQIKTYSDKLDQYNTAQTEILAVEKAVDAWEQLVSAHQQLATADRLFTHSVEQQHAAVEQVTLTKAPFESAQAEVTRLQEAGHDHTVANTEHHDSTHPIAIATAPTQTIVEQHTVIDHHI